MRGQTDEAFYYKWDSRAIGKFIDDIPMQYSEHTLPVSVLGGDLFSVSKWLQGYVKHCQANLEATNLANEEKPSNNGVALPTSLEETILENSEKFATLVEELISQYKIPTIELSEDLELETVCDIFTRLNSKGVKLDVFDLINALLTPKNIELKNLWHEARAKFESFQSDKFDIYTLQIMSILLQNYCSPKFLFHLIPQNKKRVKTNEGKFENIVLINDEQEFKERWYEAIGALEKAIMRLQRPQQYGVSSSRFLPYKSILPIFAALNTRIEQSNSDLRFKGQKKLENWYWASIFTSRYSGSVASKSAKDFQDVSEWILDDTKEPIVVQDFRDTYQNLDLHGERKSGTSTYNGIFNLLIRRGAPDFVTGQIPDYDELDDHHIVPASWGKESLPDDMFNSILNRTPLDRRTNRGVLGGNLPNVYISRMIENIGREETLKCLKKHLISEKAVDILLRKPFEADDFYEFINERKLLVIAEVGRLLTTEEELGADLQKLDKEVEGIELRIRELIAETDVEIKPHVSEKIKQRVKVGARNDPSLKDYSSVNLHKKLSFCDWRELEEIIVSKENWDKFANRFQSKASLSTRFNQIAGLRNAIRHSREVDLPTLKDGQAAIHWFNDFSS